VALTSFDRPLWEQALVGSSGAAVRPGRGGIAGQAFDCSTSPGRVMGATAALDTPARAFYTFDGLVGIEPEATATSDTGRFFFFDVPALPLTVVANLHEAIVARKVRVRPDSVTVMVVRP
jgi:hypothetical protein